MGEGSDKQRRNEEWLWNLSCNIWRWEIIREAQS
jgi:hypothetical protein